MLPFKSRPSLDEEEENPVLLGKESQLESENPFFLKQAVAAR